MALRILLLASVSGTKPMTSDNGKAKYNLMTNKIELDVSHKDKTRIEAFLRKLDEQLHPVEFSPKLWKESERIVHGIKLSNTDSSLSILILFLTTHNDANVVAMANTLPSNSTARWSANGAVMYLVESADADKVDHVLSVFAGRE